LYVTNGLMLRYTVITIFAAVLLLLVIPFVITQFKEEEARHFEWVSLGETTYQEIEFHNEVQDLNLAGMLFVPEGEGPFPAVVIIHGSGTSRRDSGWYLTLTQYLQENGILVLLPDKRGSEKSEGDWRTASFEDLATDTVAAVDYLKEQDQVSAAEIGVVGLSQGGHIAPVVASQSGDVNYVVNIVGVSILMHELLLYEENHNLRQMGFLPGFADGLAYLTTFLLRNISQPTFWNAIGNFDPLPYWEKLDVESFVLYGEKDTNVPSARSAARLISLSKPNIEVKIYPGSGHALEDPPGEGNSIFRSDALWDIVNFINSMSAP
jgi:dipeptidyl aminopeptidase/acylaminoacyl peptidase